MHLFRKVTTPPPFPTVYQLVWRTPPTNPDKTQADFNQTVAWYDMNLSAIVPTGAIAILFVVQGVMNSANNMIQFRKNGDTTTTNKPQLNRQVAAVWNSIQLTVECDTNRIIEYYQQSLWDQLKFTVMGWYVPAT